MTDTALDLCPREQRLREAASALEDAELSIEDGIAGALITYAENDFVMGELRGTEARRAFAKLLARSTHAAIIAHRAVMLPEYIEEYYELPTKGNH